MAIGGSSSYSFNPSYQSPFGSPFGERTSYQPPSGFVGGPQGFSSPFAPRSSGGGTVSSLAVNFSSLSGRVSYSGPIAPLFSTPSMSFSTQLPSSSRLESQSAFPSSSLSRAHHPISRMSSLDTPPVSGLSMGSFFALPPTGISDRSFPFSQHPLGSSTLAGRMHYPPLFTSPSFEHKGALIPTGSGFTSSLPASRSFQREFFPTSSDFSLKMDDSLYRSLATPFNPTRPLYTPQERVFSAFESTMLRRTQQIAFFDPVSRSSLIVHPQVFGAFVRAALEVRSGADWKAITDVTARSCKDLTFNLAAEKNLETAVSHMIRETADQAGQFRPGPLLFSPVDQITWATNDLVLRLLSGSGRDMVATVQKQIRITNQVREAQLARMPALSASSLSKTSFAPEGSFETAAWIIDTAIFRGVLQEAGNAIRYLTGEQPKRGDRAVALKGIAHGGVDVVGGSLLDLFHIAQRALTHMGLAELEVDLGSRVAILDTIKESQGKRVAALDRAMVQLLSLDPSDPVYRYSRLGPSLGVTIASVPGLIKSLPEWGKRAAALGRVFRSEERIAYDRALFERYKVILRQEMDQPHVYDIKLQKLMKENYRPTAETGSGSTAAAVRYEKMTGEPVKGKFHTQKARELVVRLEEWIKNNPIARAGDRAAAENVWKDLKDALGE